MMDNLINHLEKAVNEEEVKKALGLLQQTYGEGNERNCVNEKFVIELLERALFLSEPFQCKYSLPTLLLMKYLGIDNSILTQCDSIISWTSSFKSNYLILLELADKVYESNFEICQRVRCLRLEALETPGIP